MTQEDVIHDTINILVTQINALLLGLLFININFFNRISIIVDTTFHIT